MFCDGDPACGQGVVDLISQDSQHSRFTALGFGIISHAGDALNAQVLDGQRASVTCDSMVGVANDHAFSNDGAQTWTSADLEPPR